MIALSIFASFLMSAIIWRLVVLARVYRAIDPREYYRRHHYANAIANCIFAGLWALALLIYCAYNQP